MYIVDIDNLPDEGPVLLNLNHPGAFLDACLISAYSKRPLYYLTRGDFFKTPIARWFLTSTHQIPIFRAEHGMRSLRANLDTFEKVYEKLAEGEVVIIFPESVAAVEKRLRPLHKGAARITFGTYEKHGVIPTVMAGGFTFSDPRYFGYDAFVRYGDPLQVEKYIPEYQSDPKKAISDLTDEITDALNETLIRLVDDDREHLFDDAVTMLEERPPKFPPVTGNKHVIGWQDAIADAINALPDEKVAQLNEQRKAVRKDMESSRIHFDRGPQLADGDESVMVLGLVEPVMLIGDLLQAVPTWATKRFVLSKVKRPAFIGPMKSMIGFFIYILFFLALTLVMLPFIGSIAWLAGLVAVMITYFRILRHRKPRLWHWFRWRSRPADVKERFETFRQSLKQGLE